MYEHVRTFVKSAAEAFLLRGPVYEFGFCPDSAGLPPLTDGLPQAGKSSNGPGDGPLIDRLEDLSRLPFADASAHTVVSVNALEHVFEPRQVVEEMNRILSPGGILLLCSTRMPAHPDRYWQPTPRAVQRLLSCFEATLTGWQGPDQAAHTLFGVGCKSPVREQFVRGVNRFLDGFQKRLDEKSTQTPWRQRFKQLLLSWTRRETERRQGRDFHRAQFVVHLPIRRQFKHQLLASYLPEETTGGRLDVSQ